MNHLELSRRRKRALDLTISILLLFPSLLLIAFASILVAVELRASPLFVQERVGRGLRSFKLIKLRTMYPDTQHRASHEVCRSQICRSGIWLRRLKFDELPQVLNVLTGTMSFVGPRPCLVSQAEVIDRRNERGVYAMLPGITGPAQLAGIDMSQPMALALADASYLAKWTLIRDLAILAKTMIGGGSGDAVSGGSTTR